MPAKELNNPPELDPKLKAMYKMTDIKFKIIIIRQLSKMQKTTEREIK